MSGVNSNRDGVSSQAGLAAVRGPKNSYPSVPKPGEPGSRFNPIVRERQPQQSADPDVRLIRAADTPAAGLDGGKQPRQLPKRLPTAHEIAAAGRIGRKSVEGALTGARPGAAIPHPARWPPRRQEPSSVAGRGVIHEADRVTGPSGAEQKAAGKPAGSAAARTVPQSSAPIGADMVARVGAAVNKTDPAGPKGPAKSEGQGKAPLSERYNYRFEKPQPETGHPELGS